MKNQVNNSRQESTMCAAAAAVIQSDDTHVRAREAQVLRESIL